MAESPEYQIVQNPQATRQELEQVLTCNDPEARALLARRFDCPPEWLPQLARDDDEQVLHWVTINPNTPALHCTAALWRLSHGGENSRCNAAKHPAAPIELLERLGLDDSPLVRALVLTNPSCPEHLWGPLLDQALSTPAAHWILIESLDLTPEQLRQIAGGSTVSAMDVAAHPQAPEDLIHVLASHEDYRVRRIIAGRPDCPKPVLEELFMDGEPRVGIAALLNPQWQGDEVHEHLRVFIRLLLDSLAEAEAGDSTAWITEALNDVLVHPNTPPRARQMITLNVPALAHC